MATQKGMQLMQPWNPIWAETANRHNCSMFPTVLFRSIRPLLAKPVKTPFRCQSMGWRGPTLARMQPRGILRSRPDNR